jgi:low temperature requirement protein LtrA
LGESIVSAGAGVGISVTRPIVLIAATIGFVAVVSMWFLYFERVAEAAEEALDLSTGARRAELARDGYTLVHFFLIAGVLYAALGIREVLAISSSADSTNQVATLPWPAVVSLYGGAIVYLVGRATFMWLTLTIAPLAQFAVAGALLALMPLARRVSAWAGLLVVSVALVALVALERWTTYRALRGHLDQGRPVETS